MLTADEVISQATTVPLNLFIGLSKLLIAKNTVSMEEATAMVRRLHDESPGDAEASQMKRTIYSSVLEAMES
jgi:hypothetical protein